MHLEGALCKPSSIIKLLRARGIGGGFVVATLRLGSCVLHKLGVSLQLPPEPRITKMSLLEESFVLKKDLSIFALPEGVLLSDFFVCLFVHLFFLSGPWQVGRHVVIHRNLCIPDNICRGRASPLTAHLPGGIGLSAEQPCW